MATKALTLKVRIDGARETLAAFKRMPAEANRDLRARTMEIARSLAVKVASAAQSDGAQAALMAPTVQAISDRVPAIQAGGTKRVGSRSKPAFKVIFGSEFGARTLRQFRPHLGRGSYWLWRTVEANEAQISAAWLKVADDVQKSFSAPPTGNVT